MARHHSGEYSAKHPPDMTIDKKIATTVTSLIDGGNVTCAAAFSLAVKHAVSPSMIGAAIDLQEGRITKCQLGLFGYGPGPSPLDSDNHVDFPLKEAINAALVNDRLPCERAWQIADDLQLTRIEVARACESLCIRINQCQLGAF